MNVPANKSKTESKPRFNRYDCVVLKRDVKGTSLKKGEIGAIMDVYTNDRGNQYDVDFTESRELECVPEDALKLDFRVPQKKGKTLTAEDSLKPPPMPKEVAKDKF